MTRVSSRRGFVKLFAKPNVASLNCEFGTFYTEDDGTIEVPEKAIDVAATHGFYKTKEELRAAMTPRKKPKAASGTGIVVEDDGRVVERIIERHYIQPEQAKPVISAAEKVMGADRFELREYCEGNGIEIPPKTNNEALRALVLEHMKAEAAGPAKAAEVKTGDGDGDGDKKEGGEAEEADDDSKQE